jgi:hypothetical protein
MDSKEGMKDPVQDISKEIQLEFKKKEKEAILLNLLVKLQKIITMKDLDVELLDRWGYIVDDSMEKVLNHQNLMHPKDIQEMFQKNLFSATKEIKNVEEKNKELESEILELMMKLKQVENSKLEKDQLVVLSTKKEDIQFNEPKIETSGGLPVPLEVSSGPPPPPELSIGPNSGPPLIPSGGPPGPPGISTGPSGPGPSGGPPGPPGVSTGPPGPPKLGGPPSGPGFITKKSNYPTVELSPIQVPIKSLFIEKIEKRKIDQSIFIKKGLVIKSNELRNEFDLDEITNLFKKEKKEISNVSKPQIETVPTANLLDGKISQNIAIALNSISRRGLNTNEKIRSTLLSMNPNIEDEILSQLTSIVPPREEMEKIIEYEGDLDFSEVEKYLKFISDIPNLEERLKCWEILTSFELNVSRIFPPFEFSLNAFEQLMSSEKFLLILSFILSLTNLLNAKNESKIQYGFTMEGLNTLYGARMNNGITVIRYLIKILTKRDEYFVNKILEELNFIKMSGKIDFEQLEEDIGEFKDQYQLVKKQHEIVQKSNIKDDQFCEVISGLIDKFEISLFKIEEYQIKMKKTLSELSQLFGDPSIEKFPKKKDEKHFFKQLDDFLSVIVQANEANKVALQKEEKKRKKEEKKKDVVNEEDLRSGALIRKKMKSKSIKNENELL